MSESNEKKISQKIFNEIENIVSLTKGNGIPVFENLDLNKEEVIDLDEEEKEEVINLDDLDGNLNPNFNKFDPENLDLSDSNSNNDIINSCIKIDSDLGNLLEDENLCKELIDLLNDKKSKSELENLSKEEFQIYERRNWILFQLLGEHFIHERKNFNGLLDFIRIEENYIMQAINRQNKFGFLERNKYRGTRAVSTIWFLEKIRLSIKNNDYTSVFITIKKISNDICGDLLFKYLEENNQTDNFIKYFSLNSNKIENEIKLSESEKDDKENNIIFLHDVNEFIKFKENKKRFSYRVCRNKNFSFRETVALQAISDKCHFWNRRKILRNAMQNNLSDIYDFANNLPSNHRNEFFVWVCNNRANFNPELAQNAGFLSREQEELLQLVPSEKQNEFRKLFQNENFRKVCQTPQAVKNLLNVMEVSSLNPIEYINHCLSYGEIEHIKIAFDTFDENKINEFFGNQLNQLPDGVKKMYLFYFIHSWINFSFEINKIDDSIISKEDKNKLFKESELACVLYDRLDRFIENLNDPTFKKDSLFEYLDGIFSKEAIEYGKENISKVKTEEGFDAVETVAINFLKERYGYDESEGIEDFTNSFAMLGDVNFNNENYFSFNPYFYNLLLVADYNCIVDLFDYAVKKNYQFLPDEMLKNLNEPEFKKIREGVTNVIISRRTHFVAETFENDKSKIEEFYKLAGKCGVFKFINSKEDVLLLNEFLNLGLDINKINISSWNLMKGVLSKISDESSKKILKTEIVELVKKCDNEYLVKMTFDDFINKFIENKFTNNSVRDLIDFFDHYKKDTLKILADVLLSMEQPVENLANIVTLLQQETKDSNAMEFAAHLAANREVALKLTENYVSPLTKINSPEKKGDKTVNDIGVK